MFFVQYALESTQRQIDPTKLLLESSTRIASMMDEKSNPHAAEILRGVSVDIRDGEFVA